MNTLNLNFFENFVGATNYYLSFAIIQLQEKLAHPSFNLCEASCQFMSQNSYLSLSSKRPQDLMIVCISKDFESTAVYNSVDRSNV